MPAARARLTIDLDALAANYAHFRKLGGGHGPGLDELCGPAKRGDALMAARYRSSC